jgi:hypothetical protein
MPRILSCYYLDEPLSDHERHFVESVLLGPWARFKTGATSLSEKRVPLVLPMPNEDGTYDESREERAEHVRLHLRHAGIRNDNGRQVAWVAPRDTEWDAIFQFAIREETGLAPFVVQRWFVQGDTSARGEPRVIDTQMMIQNL